MKKFISICLLAGVLAVFTGCLSVSSINTGGINAVSGTGEMVTRDFAVGNFTGIDIAGGYVVVYTNSQTNAVTVNMQENLFDYLEVTVNSSGILRINSTRSFRTTSGNTPRIYVSAPYLNEIHVSGSLTTENWDTIRTQSLFIHAAGATDATIDMEVDELEIVLAGAGSFDLSGTADTAILSLAGAGTIDGENLQTQTATVTIAGASTATIAVSDVLNATISGVGTIYYIGDPQVNRAVAGIGSVRRR